MTLIDFGISKANATGDAYNLTDPAKLAGNYVAAEAGIALAGAWAVWCCAIRMGWSFTFVRSLRAPSSNSAPVTDDQDEAIALESVEGRCTV